MPALFHTDRAGFQMEMTMLISRRDTRQRRLVLRAVQARSDHPTAEQIYADVRVTDPKISHGTVYRNLNCLSEDGAICHVRVPGADRYDLRTDLHYHMFCVKCKKVIDAPYSYKEYLDEETMQQSGFEIIRHRLIFEGICPECRDDTGD
jgi:Fur family transcriptional regulator, ferric uptake regulator